MSAGEQPAGLADGELRVVVMPPVPALLPGYRGQADPVAELRDACRRAVAWLLEEAGGSTGMSGGGPPVAVLTDPPDEAAARRGIEAPLGLRVARALLSEVSGRRVDARWVDGAGPADRRLLVLANGSACRGEKAPGHLDPRSFAFDELVEKALAAGDKAVLAGLDAELGRELLAAGIAPLRALAGAGAGVRDAELRYAADPYGVRYWVATWLLTP